MKNDDANTIKIDRPFRWDAGPTMRPAGNLYVTPAIGLPHPATYFCEKNLKQEQKPKKSTRIVKSL